MSSENDVSLAEANNVSGDGTDYSAQTTENLQVWNVTELGHDSWEGSLDEWEFLRDLLNSTILSICVLMTLGLVARRRNWLSVGSADRIRWICFEYLLPAVLLRNIWLAPVDMKLSVVALWSAFFNTLRFFIIMQVVRFVEPLQRQRQGWLMLITQGEMLALLFPLLLATPQLSERALACAILWDLGGNMWLCQGIIFGIADHYMDGHSRIRTRSRSSESGLSLKVDANDVEAAVDDEKAKKEISTAQKIRRTAWTVLTKPLLFYCAVAFLLNSTGVALPPVLDTSLWALSLPFKPGIYFIVGFYGGASGLHLSDAVPVGQALLLRYTAAALTSVAVNCLLDEPLLRQTITLALFAPLTSNVMHIVAEKGSGEEQLRLTVFTSFASTILSTGLQLALVMWFTS